MVFARQLTRHGRLRRARSRPDPPDVTFAQVLDVARWIHDELVGARRGVPKTSGADGAHIYIPLPPGTPYDDRPALLPDRRHRRAQKHPKIATAERSRQAREAGACYVDYLQNIPGKTLATAYSARASEYAGVSTPLTWEEIDDGVKREAFTINDTGAASGGGDLWAALRKSKGVDLARDALRENGDDDDPSRRRADLADILRIYNQAVEKTTAVFEYRAHTIEMRREWFRAKQAASLPVLVAEESGAVRGFASYGPFRAVAGVITGGALGLRRRAGARTRHRHGAGAGRPHTARDHDLHVVMAGITSDNAVSLRLHEKLGFMEVAHIREVGYKFGRWLDLKLLQRARRAASALPLVERAPGGFHVTEIHARSRDSTEAYGTSIRHKSRHQPDDLVEVLRLPGAQERFQCGKPSSIGLKSGLSGGRHRTCTPHSRDCRTDLRLPVDDQMVEDDGIGRAGTWAPRPARHTGEKSRNRSGHEHEVQARQALLLIRLDRSVIVVRVSPVRSNAYSLVWRQTAAR